MSADRNAPALPETLDEVWAAVGDGGPVPQCFTDQTQRLHWVELEFQHVAEVLAAWVEDISELDGVAYVLDVAGWLGRENDFNGGWWPQGCLHRSLLGSLRLLNDARHAPLKDDQMSVYWRVYDPLTHQSCERALLTRVRRHIPRGVGSASETTSLRDLVDPEGNGSLFEAA